MTEIESSIEEFLPEVEVKLRWWQQPIRNPRAGKSPTLLRRIHYLLARFKRSIRSS